MEQNPLALSKLSFLSCFSADAEVTVISLAGDERKNPPKLSRQVSARDPIPSCRRQKPGEGCVPERSAGLVLMPAQATSTFVASRKPC